MSSQSHVTSKVTKDPGTRGRLGCGPTSPPAAPSGQEGGRLEARSGISSSCAPSVIRLEDQSGACTPPSRGMFATWTGGQRVVCARHWHFHLCAEVAAARLCVRTRPAPLLDRPSALPFRMQPEQVSFGTLRASCRPFKQADVHKRIHPCSFAPPSFVLYPPQDFNMSEYNPAPSPSGHPLLSGPPTLYDIPILYWPPSVSTPTPTRCCPLEMPPLRRVPRARTAGRDGGAHQHVRPER